MKSSKCCLGNIFQSWVPPSWRNVFWSCEMCGKLGSWSSFSSIVNHSTHFRKFWFLQLSHFLTPKFLRGNNFHFWHLWLFPAKTRTHLRFMCVCHIVPLMNHRQPGGIRETQASGKATRISSQLILKCCRNIYQNELEQQLVQSLGVS